MVPGGGVDGGACVTGSGAFSATTGGGGTSSATTSFGFGAAAPFVAMR